MKEMTADEKLLLCKGFLYGLCFRDDVTVGTIKAVDRFFGVIFPEDTSNLESKGNVGKGE